MTLKRENENKVVLSEDQLKHIVMKSDSYKNMIIELISYVVTNGNYARAEIVLNNWINESKK